MQIKLGKRQISHCTSPDIRMFVIRVAQLPEYELHTKISMGPRATCTNSQPLYPSCHTHPMPLWIPVFLPSPQFCAADPTSPSPSVISGFAEAPQQHPELLPCSMYICMQQTLLQYSQVPPEFLLSRRFKAATKTWTTPGSAHSLGTPSQSTKTTTRITSLWDSCKSLALYHYS